MKDFVILNNFYIGGTSLGKERIQWLDVCKGLGMMLVIVGHVLTTPVRQAWGFGMDLYNMIYFFHMPLMFYLAGRAYAISLERYIKASYTAFIAKKGRSLLIPYVVYNFCVYIIFSIANKAGSLSDVLSLAGYGKISFATFIKKMLAGDNSYAFHMWYIYGLCIIFAVTFIIDKMADYLKINKKVIAVFFIVVTMVLAGLRYFLYTATWGVINEVMQFYMWFVIGTYLDISKYVQKKGVIAFEILSIVYLFGYTYYEETMKSVMGYRLCSIISWIPMAGLICLFVSIACLLKGILKRFFLYTGKNSYGIYVFHQPFFGSGVGLVMIKVFNAPVILSAFVAFCLCYIVPIAIIRLLHTRYLSFLAPFFIGSTIRTEGKINR